MRIVLLRGGCGNARTCPNVNRTDRDSYVVQGYAARPGLALPPGEAEVRVPLSLVPERAAVAQRTPVRRVANGFVVIRGNQIVDKEVLAELAMPSDENAVEIPVSAVPPLAATHVG